MRLLDSDGDFTGEVVSSAEGDFRFYAAPGDWTVRALHRSGNGEASVTADGPGLHQLAISRRPEFLSPVGGHAQGLHGSGSPSRRFPAPR